MYLRNLLRGKLRAVSFDTVLQYGILLRMVPKKSVPQHTVRWNEPDLKLMTALHKKLGVDFSQIIRLAIRALATKEGVTA